MESVSKENGTGGSSPRSTWKRLKSIERRSSRGGVPVLSRPHLKPNAFQRLGEVPGRRLAGATGRGLLRTDMNQAVQESPGGDDQRPAGDDAAVRQLQSVNPTASVRILLAGVKIQSISGTASRVSRTHSL